MPKRALAILLFLLTCAYGQGFAAVAADKTTPSAPSRATSTVAGFVALDNAPMATTPPGGSGLGPTSALAGPTEMPSTPVPAAERKVEEAPKKPKAPFPRHIEAPSSIETALGTAASANAPPGPQPFNPAPLRQFGYDFFSSTAVGFPPSTDGPIPPDYVLGPGDVIVLTLWGSIEGTWQLKVGRGGEINLPKVGTLRVWGTRFEDMEKLVREHIGRVFKDFEVDVNLGEIRLVKIYVVGEVRRPGGYNLGALSTVISALGAAGGPTKNGTLRSVQVKRGGKVVQSIDLYDFFIHGDKSTDLQLRDGDVVFVPVIGTVAGVRGYVKRPGIYELDDEGSLADLIDLAGGETPTSYLKRVQISRVQPHDERVVQDISLAPTSADEPITTVMARIPIQDLDVVTVYPIDRSLQRFVELEGYVLRPGPYALKAGMRLTDLLLPDNLLPEYYPDVVQIKRLFPPDYHPQILLADLRAALDGNLENDLKLQEFDTVRVFSRWEMEEVPTVQVQGAVQKPDTYRLFEGMRVRDLVMLAGNLKPGAFRSAAEIERIRKTDTTREVYRISIDLGRALAGDPAHNIELAPDDKLEVRQAPLIPDPAYKVRVTGEVPRPGDYPLYDRMTVRDLLREAGDPTPIRAYLKNAELSRIRIENGSITSFPIVLDLEKVLQDDPTQNLTLEPYDELIVRRVPNWLEETERYVTVQGEVTFPGRYPIFRGERLSSVISRAGGFTDNAYLPAAKFTRKLVQAMQQRRLAEVLERTRADIAQKEAELASVASSEEELAATQASLDGLRRSLQILERAEAEGRVVIRIESLETLEGSPYDVELQGEDTLTVPQSSAAVLVVGEVYNPTTILAVPGATVANYLARAGGPTQQAEEDEMYVIRSDGSVVSRQQPHAGNGQGYDNWFTRGEWGGDTFLGLRLLAGDTLVVPQKLEKIAWMREIKDITQIISQVALTAGVLIAAGL